MWACSASVAPRRIYKRHGGVKRGQSCLWDTKGGSDSTESTPHASLMHSNSEWCCPGLMDGSCCTWPFREKVWLFSKEEEASSKPCVIFIFIRFIGWSLRARTHTQSDTAEQTPLCSLSWLNHHFPGMSRSTMTRENIIHLMTRVENWLNRKITRKFCSSKRNLPKQQFPTCTSLDSIKIIFNHIIHEMLLLFFSATYSHTQGHTKHRVASLWLAAQLSECRN